MQGLLGTGAQQRALQQQALGAARGEFERALRYPQQQFDFLRQAVSGIPTQQGGFQQQKTGLGGILGTGASLFGALGLNPFSGLAGLLSGGGAAQAGGGGFNPGGMF